MFHFALNSFYTRKWYCFVVLLFFLLLFHFMLWKWLVVLALGSFEMDTWPKYISKELKMEHLLKSGHFIEFMWTVWECFSKNLIQKPNSNAIYKWLPRKMRLHSIKYIQQHIHIDAAAKTIVDRQQWNILSFDSIYDVHRSICRQYFALQLWSSRICVVCFSSLVYKKNCIDPYGSACVEN